MNLFYDDAGQFKIGRVLQQQGSAYQVETLHGKRSKVKANAVLLSFEGMELQDFAEKTELEAAGLDIELLWECAPEGEFEFGELAKEYFGNQPTPTQQAGLLQALHSAPVYFHRKGRGKYRAAPEDILKAALAGLEKKRRLAEQQAQWADALVRHELPDEIAKVAAQLLARPDKNSLEYKALVDACGQAGRSPEVLLIECGAFESVHQMMKARFMSIYFPRGTHSNVTVPALDDSLERLPIAAAPAFSIDDTSTTEIDDAFSVQWLGNGRARVGVHIAAPALVIERGDELDRLARDRMSTVYSPGDKITMLPDTIVELSTLAAGRTVPAASLYIEVDLATGEPLGEPASILEQVKISENLRHNLLDEAVTVEALEDESIEQVPEVGEHFAALKVLWKCASFLRQQREEVRGQPEKHSRIDFSFYVSDDGVVDIVPRRRDAPLDLLVAEWMIFANCQWGGLLDKYKVPGIYRVQPPAGRVKMSTHAGPHVGIGVPQYAWCTSPLRRYVDLINQQQLVSVIRGQSPVYEASDADLLSAVNSFDVTYKAYADYQSNMERYWCLRWIQQRERSKFEGVVVRDELVRLHEIPLFVRLVGVTSPGRGAQVEVELDQIDELTLTVSCKLLSVQSSKPTSILDEDELEELFEEPDGASEAEVAEKSKPDAEES